MSARTGRRQERGEQTRRATLVIAFGDGLAISPLFDESQDRTREIDLFADLLAQSSL